MNIFNHKRSVFRIISALLLASVITIICIFVIPDKEEAPIIDKEGTVEFYTATTDEHKNPAIEKSYKMSVQELETFLKEIEAQKWTNDAFVDRLSFQFDGRIHYKGYIFFGFEQKILFYNGEEGGYFTELSTLQADKLRQMQKTAEVKQVKLGIKLFKTNAIAYESGNFDFVQWVENVPQYRIEDGKLYESPKQGDGWSELGILEKITLTKENFDKRLRQDYWQLKYTASGMREENLRAWEVKIKGVGISQIYIILEQRNGKFYICYGYYDLEGQTDPVTEDNSYIRWIYETDVSYVNYNPSFTASVIKKEKNKILVEPKKNQEINDIGNEFYVSTEGLSEDNIPKLKKGDKVKITYDGVIETTDPAYIGKVYEINKLK